MFQAFKDFGNNVVSANMVASKSAVNGGQIQIIMEEHHHLKIYLVVINALLYLPVQVWLAQGCPVEGMDPLVFIPEFGNRLVESTQCFQGA
jgi:hypothetical protein